MSSTVPVTVIRGFFCRSLDLWGGILAYNIEAYGWQHLPNAGHDFGYQIFDHVDIRMIAHFAAKNDCL